MRSTTNLNLTVWDDNNDDFNSSELAANWDAIDADYSRARIAYQIQEVAALGDVPSPEEGTLAYLTASDSGFSSGTILKYTSSVWIPVSGVEVLADVPTLGNFPGRIVLLSSDSGSFLAWDLIKYDGSSWTKISSVTSVFGRLGDVVAEAGDYLLTDISADTNHALAISGGTYMGSLDTGTEGQLLISGGTDADPSWVATAAEQSGPADQGVTTTGGTPKMAGLSDGISVITPNSTRVFAQITGYIDTTSSGTDGAAMHFRYGTGTGPSNGDSSTGTIVGTTLGPIAVKTGLRVPFTMSGIITGLTPGTPLWFDLRLWAVSGTNTVNVHSNTIIAFDLI